MVTVLNPQTPAEITVIELHDRVWNHGDFTTLERLVAPRYTIFSDPGDAWEGQALDRPTYAHRVRYSRTAFPDLSFVIHETVAAHDRVATRWTATGTHAGDLRGIPATGRRLTFTGQTLYAIDDGRVAGHWQVVDRLGFLQQLPGVLARLASGAGSGGY